MRRAAACIGLVLGLSSLTAFARYELVTVAEPLAGANSSTTVVTDGTGAGLDTSTGELTITNTYALEPGTLRVIKEIGGSALAARSDLTIGVDCTDGSSIMPSAKLPVMHIPIAPTPLPPSSAWTCRQSARSQSTTGLDSFAASTANSREMHARVSWETA